MRIKQLQVNRYKSIEDPILINNFSNLHILVGPNNAGKTNVLDAINIFFDQSLDKERFADRKASMKITIEKDGQEYALEYFGPPFNDQSETILKLKKHFVRIGDASLIYGLIPQELKYFAQNYPKKYREFSLTLRDYFKDVEISEELFVLSVHAEEKKHRPLRRIGEGFKRLFVILFYFFHPEYNIILIDEPELHLHPSIIKKLLFILKEKDLQKQIFLTTHHPTFIQASCLQYVWRISKNKNESTVIHGLNSSNINVDRFVQEINDDNSSMLFSDKVLLVEGISDKIFMQEILDRFYQKEKDIKVVYTGGKGTVDLYAELCNIFNIPCAIMLDGDALYSPSLQKMKGINFIKKNISNKEKIKRLKDLEIFILERDLEYTFPKRYKRRETKPLNALFVSRRMTAQDLDGPRMRIIKEVLETI